MRKLIFIYFFIAINPLFSCAQKLHENELEICKDLIGFISKGEIEPIINMFPKNDQNQIDESLLKEQILIGSELIKRNGLPDTSKIVCQESSNKEYNYKTCFIDLEIDSLGIKTYLMVIFEGEKTNFKLLDFLIEKSPGKVETNSHVKILFESLNTNYVLRVELKNKLYDSNQNNKIINWSYGIHDSSFELIKFKNELFQLLSRSEIEKSTVATTINKDHEEIDFVEVSFILLSDLFGTKYVTVQYPIVNSGENISDILIDFILLTIDNEITFYYKKEVNTDLALLFDSIYKKGEL